jgi:hypothetical protein
MDLRKELEISGCKVASRQAETNYKEFGAGVPEKLLPVTERKCWRT